MATLEALGISGFRSYSDTSLQKIDFEGSLTLVWGKNGSGKTTIIEVLKYITTGCLPPQGEKGRNFILEPRIAGKNEVVGEVRLKFRTFNERPILAKRRALLSTSNRGHKFESVEQSLKTRDNNGDLVEISHQCAQIQKQVPQLLGMTKAVLENIVFCHQDESLWPFSESAHLKAIFDEMFETKQVTKVTELLWEKQKEMGKFVRENNKSQEYMKRLNDESNKRRSKALKEMEKISKESEALLPLKNKISQMKEILVVKESEQKETKAKNFIMIKKRGSLEEKASIIAKLISQFENKMKAISQLYQKETGKELKVKEGVAIEEAINQNCQKLAELTETKNSLIQILEESKNLNVYTQKQMEIMAQIKRAHDHMPELKRQSSLAEEEVLDRIRDKIGLLENKRKELATTKQQLNRIVSPNFLDLFMSEASYEQKKDGMKGELLKVQQITQRIMFHYSRLYHQVEKKGSKQPDSSIENRLRETQYALKAKKEQLEKYKKMPKMVNINEEIFKTEFAGITMYDNLYCFCQQRQKCLFCSKPVSKQQLEVIKGKCDKIKNKTFANIEELKEKYKDQPDTIIEPEKMIKKITEEIQTIEFREKQEAKMYQIYLNEKLVSNLRRVGLQFKGSNQSYDEPSSIQVFMDLINRYENLKFRLEALGKDLKQYEDRVKRNREIEQERSANERRRGDFTKKISVLEEETKQYGLLSDIEKRLAALLKVRGKSKSKDTGKDSKTNEQYKIEQLNQKLANIQKSISCITLQKNFYEISAHLATSKKNLIENTQQMDEVDRQIKSLNANIQDCERVQAEYNNLEQHFESKSRELSLKSELSYAQYERPTEKDYFRNQIKVQSQQQAQKDIETLHRVIENATSRYHQQKMDEVNKIIHDIWKAVYHEKDISNIAIQAAHELDSKKKKNFHYSIVMERQLGGESGRMEMKGRCSMGQKVLASIVIRLALAEVFSSGACILALDEPTTYLDRQHIDNLAFELGRLIEISGGRLQLIIISHDLQFIKCLEKYTNHFYEVNRDENNFSIIKKKDILQIYEER